MVANHTQSYSSDTPSYIISGTPAVNTKGSKGSKSKGSKSKGSQMGKSGKSSKNKNANDSYSNQSTFRRKDTVQVEQENLVNEVYEIIKASFATEEFAVIKQAVAMYHNGDSVENLLNRILPFFTPLKFSLLRGVRRVIHVGDRLKYDALVTSYLGRKKREYLIRLNSTQSANPSAWQEEYQHPIVNSEVVNQGVPLPGMHGKEVANDIVLKPVKSDDVDEKGIEESETTFHFQPPEQDLELEITGEGIDEPDNLCVMKSEHPPSPPSPFADEKGSEPSYVHVETEVKDDTEVASPPIEDEIEDVAPPKPKPSFKIKKDTSGDAPVLSLHKTDAEKESLLIFKDTLFDKTTNTLTINAMLNMDKFMVNKKSIKAVPEEVTTPASAAVAEDATAVTEDATVVTEDATVVTEDVAVVTEDVVVSEDVVVAEDLTVTMASPDVQLDAGADSGWYGELVDGSRICTIDKKHKIIGLSISGGSDSVYQQDIRVVSVKPDSAAYFAGIQVDQVLLSIGEHSLLNVSHAKACHLIRSTFRDKTCNTMEVCVIDKKE